MRRALVIGCVLCGLCFCAVAAANTMGGPATTSAASATGSTGASATVVRSCRYTSRPPAFPDVRRLTVTHGWCSQARRVARSIQRYWRAHSSKPPAEALPKHAAGFTCAYRLRHEPTGDPYYRAACRRGATRVHMNLTS